MKKIVFVILSLVFGLLVFLAGKVLLDRFLNRPINIVIANKTSTSVAVSFTTSKKSKSCLIFWPLLKKVCQINPAPSRLHYFDLEGLSASKKYHFLIKDGFFLFGSYWQIELKSQKLDKVLASPVKLKLKSKRRKKLLPALILSDSPLKPDFFPISGLILDNQEKPTRAIVYFKSLKDDLIISGLTDSGGNFSLNIQPFVKQNFVDFSALGEESDLQINLTQEKLNGFLRIVLP